MAERPPIVCSLVERGWRAARECSLDPQQQDVRFLHLVKGRLPRPLRALIAPRPNVRIISVPRQAFWAAAWVMLLGLRGCGRLQGVLVDNEKAWRRVEAFSRAVGAALSLVRPGAERYELWAGSARWPNGAWQTAVRRCASH